MSQRILVLLSGGIDSTALIHYYTALHYQVSALTFHYGQSAAQKEWEAAQSVAKHYAIAVSQAHVAMPLERRGDEVLGRNALFVLLASANLPSHVHRVALGIHAGTPYYDCSARFLKDIQNLLDGYFSGTVTVEAPFLKWGKGEIYSYCKDQRIPVHLTYSCERSDTGPCGECPSCLDRRRLL